MRTRFPVSLTHQCASRAWPASRKPAVAKKNGTAIRATPSFNSTRNHQQALPTSASTRTWMATTRHAHTKPRLASFPLVSGESPV